MHEGCFTIIVLVREPVKIITVVVLAPIIVWLFQKAR